MSGVRTVRCVVCGCRLPRRLAISWTTNEDRSRQWLAALAGDDDQLYETLSSRVECAPRGYLCATHFPPDHFHDPEKRTRLYGHAVPSMDVFVAMGECGAVSHDHSYSNRPRGSSADQPSTSRMSPSEPDLPVSEQIESQQEVREKEELEEEQEEEEISVKEEIKEEEDQEEQAISVKQEPVCEPVYVLGEVCVKRECEPLELSNVKTEGPEIGGEVEVLCKRRAEGPSDVRGKRQWHDVKRHLPRTRAGPSKYLNSFSAKRGIATKLISVVSPFTRSPCLLCKRLVPRSVMRAVTNSEKQLRLMLLELGFASDEVDSLSVEVQAHLPSGRLYVCERHFGHDGALLLQKNVLGLL